MNILVTSASRKVSLVRAFKTALERTGGGSVVAADVSPLAAALYAADAAELVPQSDAPDFIDAIVAICVRHDIGLIVPTRDEELPVFARTRDRLARSGVVVAVSDADVVTVCQDKLTFHGFCLRQGLGVARVYDDPAYVTFPAFVRPRRGKGGIGAAVVHDAAELQRATEGQASGFIIQELIVAPEYTIDLLADFDGGVVSIVSRRRVEVIGGESWIGCVDMRDDILAAARRLAATMIFRGHVTIQAFVTPGGVLFIEVNPRFGGGAALGWAAGAPTPEYLVRIVGGEDFTHDPALIRDGLVMLRHTDDVFLPPDRVLGHLPA
jgi:carbamoyl-phosphate synthase large subunit